MKFILRKMNLQEASEILKKEWTEIDEMSTKNQILIGGTTGLATGYIYAKYGKILALTVGTTVFLWLIGHYSSNISKLKDLKTQAILRNPSLGAVKDLRLSLEKDRRFGFHLKNFLQKNAKFGISFVVAILIGVAL